MKTITFITGNENKATQIARYLTFPVAHESVELIEIQSLDVEAVARDKAERAYAMLQKPVLVEDTALYIDALGGLPGPFIKWFLEGVGNDGICEMMREKTDRVAVAITCFALCDETGVHTFTGERNGTISDSPRGEDFGWNPIFIPDDSDRTWGEMSTEESRAYSMRRLALEKVQEFLEKHYS